MKTLEATIRAAREYAGATDSMQIVGRIGEGWVYCGTADKQSLDKMAAPTFGITEEGIMDHPCTTHHEMLLAGIQGEQNGSTTTYWVGDEAVVVGGNDVTVRGRD